MDNASNYIARNVYTPTHILLYRFLDLASFYRRSITDVKMAVIWVLGPCLQERTVGKEYGGGGHRRRLRG